MNTISFRKLQRLNSSDIKKLLPVEVLLREEDKGKEVVFVIRKPEGK